MTTATIELPPKIAKIFERPRGSVRYRWAKGGRGSGKSANFALMAAVFGYSEKLRILGTRELQVSIKESFHAEVKKAIESRPWLADHYEIGESFIRGKNGTEFLFRGLRHNMSAIKSMSDIDIVIVEEAEDVPENSWIQLIPTIRNPRSEIWVIWNQRQEDSPTNKRFGIAPPANSVGAFVNWSDNPFFPAVLNEERLHDLKTMEPAMYRHIWEGAYLKVTAANILASKVVITEFDRDAPSYYQGIDYGFANDPLAAIRCFEKKEGDFTDLYISHEFSGVGVEINDHEKLITQEIPGFDKIKARADSARPEITSHLRKNGMPLVESCVKWHGSVKDGVDHLRKYRRIYVHPSCTLAAKEFMAYSYVIDRMTGEIKPEPQDKHNNTVDATRYALQPVIMGGRLVFTAFDQFKHVINQASLLAETKARRSVWRYYFSSAADNSEFCGIFAAIHEGTKKVIILGEYRDLAPTTKTIVSSVTPILSKLNPTGDDYSWRKITNAEWFASEVALESALGVEHIKEVSGLSVVNDFLEAGLLVISDECSVFLQSVQSFGLDKNGKIPRVPMINALLQLFHVAQISTVPRKVIPQNDDARHIDPVDHYEDEQFQDISIEDEFLN